MAGVLEGIRAETGEVNAELMLEDSRCSLSAHALVVTQPFPILQDAANGFAQVINKQLPGLKVETATLQPSDLGTPAATTAIVSAIQADPAIKYVYAT